MEQSKSLNKKGGRVAIDRTVKEGCFNVDVAMRWYRADNLKDMYNKNYYKRKKAKNE